MKTRAAVLRDVGKDWEVIELDLDPPRAGEVLIRFAAAGLCHSDDHLRTGEEFRRRLHAKNRYNLRTMALYLIYRWLNVCVLALCATAALVSAVRISAAG